MKREIPDIEPEVSLLCTQVTKSSLTDWCKLVRVLKFLKRKISYVRIMGINELGKFFTWMDTLYATHVNICIHTGGAISMTHGTIINKSVKHKLNLKSSTESEKME